MKNKLFITLFGVIAVAVGIFLVKNQAKLERVCTVPATAQIIGYEESENYDAENGTTSTNYSPVLRYSADGKEYEVTYDTGSGKKEYGIGEEVEIRFNPENHEQTLITGDNSRRIAGIIVLIIGGLLTLYGLGTVVVYLLA